MQYMKSTKLTLATVCALMGVSAGLRADVLVDSFETSPVIAGTPANPPYTAVSQSSVWASDGTSSLAVTFDSSMTWSWIYVAGPSGQNYFPRETYWDWYNHTKLQFDVYRPASNPSGNLDVSAAMNGIQGWAQQADLINWVWQNTGQSSVTTVTWDYSALRNAAPAPDLVGYTDWWQLALMPRGGSGGTVYIDNVRFIDPVPEPSVIALMVLAVPAGLVLRGRRP